MSRKGRHQDGDCPPHGSKQLCKTSEILNLIIKNDLIPHLDQGLKVHWKIRTTITTH